MLNNVKKRSLRSLSLKNGYTMLEVMFVIIMIGAGAFVGGMLYVAGHFISKFW